MSPFKEHHFQYNVILQEVRSYCQYGIIYLGFSRYWSSMV
ncbi:transposase-like protein [Serratia sp. 121840015-2]